MSVGGHDSVRGYQERHHVGDYGFNASIELRTPLLQNFLPGLVREESFIRENPEDVAMHRLQGVVFYDLGWAAFHEPLAGQPDDLTLNSLGVGLRLGVTKHGQFPAGLRLRVVGRAQRGRRRPHPCHHAAAVLEGNGDARC